MRWLNRHAVVVLPQALAGDPPGTLTIKVPCHSPRTARWFGMLVSSRRDDAGQRVGATVTLYLTRSETRALVTAASTDTFGTPGAGSPSGRDLILVLTSRLFNVGLELQASARLAEGPLAVRLRRAVEELDTIIAEARTAVFPPDPVPDERR